MSELKSRHVQAREAGESIRELLESRLPKIGVDGYVDIKPSRLGGAVRVRIVSETFDGMTVEDREELAEPLLEELPEDIQRMIVSYVLSGLREYETPTADDFLIRSQNESFDQPLDNLAAPYTGATDA